jgi:hypothetical protein
MSKAYCGIGKIPKTQKKGTMKECAEKKQVRLYGLYKIDPQLVNPKAKPSSKEKKMGKNDIRALIFKFKGRFQRLKAELEAAKTDKDKKRIKAEMEETKKQHNHYTMVIKKMGDKDKITVKMDSKKDTKKDTKKGTKKDTKKGTKKGTKKDTKKTKKK